MAEPSGADVLRKLLKPSTGGASAAMSETRAWRLCVPRVSEESVGLLASVSGVESAATNFDAILADWDEHALHLSLQGEGGVRGIAILDAGALASLIDVQTTGRVGTSTPDPRSPTAIDAAMAGHVIDAWLDGFGAQIGSSDIWRTGPWIADARAGKLAIDQGAFSVETVMFSFGEGARYGTLSLLMPLGAAPRAAKAAPKRGAPAKLAVEVEVHAVLCRSKVAFRWLSQLKPGDTLALPEGVAGQVRLETQDGRLLTHGRLGQSRGRKAIKLDAGQPALASPAPELSEFSTPMSFEADPENPPGALPPLEIAMPGDLGDTAL
ncbi:FliM/FliN family flagellar motor C-terminal domain-containing protein [Ovoidimarina sediminis]|uniref:FliM/FliN family flagellar motor C-terminal domain-containing protein n=1 Tax=Ovoidimarina sediminis TaxID=3079856 RepID=UPI0029143635|nr:FliM/FliN family flagellar motor C-terminal domain-containing protein [Rhodophyticola sp. MJ-SS7]MDU8946564.1 FliM/FliN family flagellar motor C-terminal domain-containing protein [Rhodophyticola sp. MJ-SS7]